MYVKDYRMNIFIKKKIIIVKTNLKNFIYKKINV